MKSDKLEMTEPPSSSFTSNKILSPIHYTSKTAVNFIPLFPSPFLQPHCLSLTLNIPKLEYSNSFVRHLSIPFIFFHQTYFIYPVTRALFLNCKIGFVSLLLRSPPYPSNTFRIKYIHFCLSLSLSPLLSLKNCPHS